MDRVPLERLAAGRIARLVLYGLTWLMLLAGSTGSATARELNDDEIKSRAAEILQGRAYRYFRRLGPGEGSGPVTEQLPFEQQPGDPAAGGDGNGGADRDGQAGGRNGNGNRQFGDGPDGQNRGRDLERMPEWQRRMAERQANREADQAPPNWKPRSGRDVNGSSGSTSGSVFSASDGAGVLSSIMMVLAWCTVGVAVAFIVFIIIRSVANMSEKLPENEGVSELQDAAMEEVLEAPPGQLAADVYVKRARQLASKGMYREAIVQLLLGAMSSIERAGLLRFRRGLTLRDYLRAVRATPNPHSSLRSMIRIYEPLGFGRRDATRKHFELTLAGYEQGFGDEELAGAAT